MLATDRLGRPHQGVDRLPLLLATSRSFSRSVEPASISSCAARSSSPTSSSPGHLLGLRTASWLTSQAARVGFCNPFTQPAASASPSERNDFASSFSRR